jgi:alpha-beta hydrolase superfamily lysophospholipase
MIRHTSLTIVTAALIFTGFQPSWANPQPPATMPSASIEPSHIAMIGSADGQIAAYWYLQNDSNTTIILGHGYLDHARSGQPAIARFVDWGNNVLAWDLPGHGLSWGQAGTIDDFRQYATALDAVLAHVTAMRPSDSMVFIGFSTSCAAFLAWHREIWLAGHATTGSRTFPVKTVILISPLIRSWLYGLSGLGWRIGRLFITELRPRTKAASHNRSYSRDFFADPLTVKRMPISWVAAHRTWEMRTRAWQADPLPLMIIQGTGDTVLDWRYNLTFLTKCYPAADTRMIKAAWHNLLRESEPYAGEVYALLRRTIEQGIPGQSGSDDQVGP